MCDPATALCQCKAPYLGPNCAQTGNRVLLSDARGLAMHYAVANGQLFVRIESTKEANWMGVGIGADPADGMSRGDMWVVHKTTTGWLIEDQFGNAGTGRPTAAEQQDLLHRIVWQPTPTTLAASFSRLLVTNDTMFDVPLANSGANTLVTWAMGASPVYGAAHADAENNGADQFEMNVFTACPNACSGHGQCPPGVPAAFANQCQCQGAWVGPACDVPATNANMTLSAALGFVLVWGQSAGDATLHFRLESKQANWMAIGTNANLDDGMTLGDFAVVFRDAAFNWAVQDQYGAGQVVPQIDKFQNLMHTNVWNASATAPSLHASWSRLIDSLDAAQDWPFVPRHAARPR